MLLIALEPLSFPVAAIAVVHAWGIPALYANRGANVVRPRPRAGCRRPSGRRSGCSATCSATRRATCTRARGWRWSAAGSASGSSAEAGALLVRPGGRRVDCWCVKVDGELPSADRTAHLLLALREDEEGFATVANLAFSGAPWRLRRRLPRAMRPALDAARARA